MKSEWFNPKEHLPAIYGEYLVIHEYYGLLSKKYEYEVVFYDDKDTWWGADISYKTNQILAWCELPILPNFLEK